MVIGAYMYGTNIFNLCTVIYLSRNVLQIIAKSIIDNLRGSKKIL
jgi:hypothetical protein